MPAIELEVYNGVHCLDLEQARHGEYPVVVRSPVGEARGAMRPSPEHRRLDHVAPSCLDRSAARCPRAGQGTAHTHQLRTRGDEPIGCAKQAPTK
jgi:hypothetical protein